MRALVTNDDGIDSTGLRTLAGVAVDAGLDVIVAAPDTEYSGTSAAFTALEADGRLLLHEHVLDGLGGVRALAVEAAPGFIVFAAAQGAFGPPPELVLSGVNHGRNTGHAVLHSGTVGAALTATTHGAPALAVSLSAQCEQWDTAAAVTRRVLDWLLQHPVRRPVVLNVNVPDVPLRRLRGLHAARLAAFGAVQADIGEVGEGYVTMTFRGADAELEPGTDAALVADGWATVTPLTAPCHADGVDLTGLFDAG
ncbi:MAG: 5'/3'-nucleotidase SurE [Actinomycetota bacterium]|nr:5'/3'-nucleotidase SurE [Actinomycetota bacterium]